MVKMTEAFSPDTAISSVTLETDNLKFGFQGCCCFFFNL